jgi:hypothetical protein
MRMLQKMRLLEEKGATFASTPIKDLPVFGEQLSRFKMLFYCAHQSPTSPAPPFLALHVTAANAVGSTLPCHNEPHGSVRGSAWPRCAASASHHPAMLQLAAGSTLLG